MGNESSRPSSSPSPSPSSRPSTKAAAGPSEKSKAFEKRTELPDDVVTQVFSFSALPLKEKAALARTSNYYYGLFREQIHAAQFLMLVARGNQDAAAEMLTRNSNLLLECANVTDYSGRTFKYITAYEYAYWAKDTHMCRMLEAYMDEATKAKMLERIDAMEKDGLAYEQRGEVKHSKHFDFTPLKDALKRYTDFFYTWGLTVGGEGLRRKAWMQVGLAQRDLPVHVLNEYFHPDRAFFPIPEFSSEEILPRSLTFETLDAEVPSVLFSLDVSVSYRLGVHFALMREGCSTKAFAMSLLLNLNAGYRDLDAITHLDVVRTADLTLSRENLQPRGPELMPS